MQALLTPEIQLNILLIAAICLVAYMLRLRQAQQPAPEGQMVYAVERGRQAAKELQKIAGDMNVRIQDYQSLVSNLQQRLTKCDTIDVDDVEKTVSRLRQLTADLGLLRNRIGQQTYQLKALTESRIDPLTGTANRRSFEEELKALLSRHRATGDCFALGLLDIDHFKRVNDTFGHPAGDRVLKLLARVIVENVRQIDFVARTGGEEFIVLMPGSDLAGAGYAVERIRLAVEATPIKIAQDTIHVTVSAGVAVPTAGESLNSLVARADATLYSAKEEGRNQTYLQQDGVMFTPPTPTKPAAVIETIQHLSESLAPVKREETPSEELSKKEAHAQPRNGRSDQLDPEAAPPRRVGQ